MSQIKKLESIFAIPIKAVINADFNAAETASKYIKKFGFTSHDNNDIDGSNLGTLKETSFIYDAIGNDGKTERRLIKIPSLSLIPLPLLHVDHADFDFSVRIVDSDEIIEDDSVNAILTSQQNNKPTNPNAPNLDANINVKMKVVQSDIPAGISNLLALMGTNTLNKAIDIITLQHSQVFFSSQDELNTYLRLTDPNKKPIKNALVSAWYEERTGISLFHNHHHWKNGHSVRTDENGKIPYLIKCNHDIEDEYPKSLSNITFIYQNDTTITQQIARGVNYGREDL